MSASPAPTTAQAEQVSPGSRGRDESALAAVRLRGLSKSYGEVCAIDGVDLTVGRGEFFTMLGPSGSGKTTMLRIIAGFERADAGRVELHGADVTDQPPYARNVNTVFQDYALFPHMTVGANIEYGLRVKGMSREDRKTKVMQALGMVGLEGLDRRKPIQLSGGQRQRVALARAIVNQPEVLLLDEPLGALDLKLRQNMQLELKAIQRQAGMTFVYVTHDQEEALTMSDHIAVFNRGRIEQLGSPVELYESPTTEYVAGFIGVSNVLERDGRRFSVRPERLQLLEDDEPPPESAAVESGTIAEVVYLGMVTRFSVALDSGETVAVVRQNIEKAAGAHTDSVGRKVQVAWRPDQSHQLDPAKIVATSHRQEDEP